MVARAAVCGAAVKETFEKDFSNLYESYKSISSDAQVLELNRPFFLKAQSKKVVVLVHGFMGSADELRPLAEDLHLRGYNVYAHLIPGHGASGEIANAFSNSFWVQDFQRKMNLLAGCFSEIHLVGFSTGGLLIHNYITTNARVESLVHSVTLYSPFYFPHHKYLAFLGGALGVVLNDVSVTALYKLTGFPDIRIMTLRPEAYMQVVPLKMAQEVLSLGREVGKRSGSASLRTPVLLFYSASDQIADQEGTVQVTNRDFQDIQRIHFSADSIPHHLMKAEVSSVAESVRKQTLQFIEAHRGTQ